ncbi:MAG: NADH:flavin oxidoreductase [Proteobacteria bacterium]|nr:NADH:flavin oxidoreductase [Pseudomonadota bacterium]MBU1386625.1 NADH:flavin oxidoreductase [Pseudomonadota bacterium]MBU1542369.1 NADH:flavin oxidoreductase [Pseudomonadota bacterium]MBU2480519.1 NADH:flavin oxidoreductase [Pseudomonadota bacterium]
MPELFESTQINGMTIKNRFVRSATYEAMAAPDGSCTERLKNCMVQLARADVGLIISGHAYITQQGQAGPCQLGIYSDTLIEGLKHLTASVHENSGIIAAQLAHAGWRGIGKDAHPPVGPSQVFKKEVKRASAMTLDDIRKTVTAFGDAAQRAVESGFDAIQIHAAHSYLLSQFLSPFYNQRTDEYGGPLENRARFLLEVYTEIRKRVGTSFPVMVKMNSEDFLENGFTPDEMITVCRHLEEKGIDAVEMSGGTHDSGKFLFARPGTAKSEDREAYYKNAAQKFKEHIKTPLILVGGFLSYPIAHNAVKQGFADYIAFSRPLIREPDLIKRWAAGDTRKAACISCNKCFSTLFTEQALHCAADK